MPSSTRPFRFHIDPKSGVPFYRQILESVLLAVGDGRLLPGDRLPTVRATAVDLSVNLNTAARAYRELEIRGVVATQQGVGTFISERRPDVGAVERERRLDGLVDEFLARAGGLGFGAEEVARALADRAEDGSTARTGARKGR